MTSIHDVVETTAGLRCATAAAWSKVCFYEHVETPPPWLLRTVMPVPRAVSGACAAVGDVSRCLYSDGGWLTKIVTNIVPGERIEFDVTEQTIRWADLVELRGGTIELVPRDQDTCLVRMRTRLGLRRQGARVLLPAIRRVVRAVHHVVIDDMRRVLPHTADQHATPFDVAGGSA